MLVHPRCLSSFQSCCIYLAIIHTLRSVSVMLQLKNRRIHLTCLISVVLNFFLHLHRAMPIRTVMLSTDRIRTTLAVPVMSAAGHRLYPVSIRPITIPITKRLDSTLPMWEKAIVRAEPATSSPRSGPIHISSNSTNRIIASIIGSTTHCCRHRHPFPTPASARAATR